MRSCAIAKYRVLLIANTRKQVLTVAITTAYILDRATRDFNKADEHGGNKESRLQRCAIDATLAIPTLDKGEVMTVQEETTPVHSFFSHEVETELLCIAVSAIISKVSVMTGLSEREIMELLSRKNLNVLGEIEDLMRFPRNVEIVRRTGAEPIVAALRETIISVASLADLDCDAIIRALTRANSKTIEDFVSWLRSGTWEDFAASPS